MENATAHSFLDAEKGGFSDSREWFDLLSKHRRGCAEVHLQTFRGRAGFVTFKEVRCLDSDKKPVEHNTEANYDAQELAKEAHKLCLAHQKKHLADSRYRMQLLVRKKKGGELHNGEWCGLVLSPDGYTHLDDYSKGGQSETIKILSDHNGDLRTFIQAIMGSQVAIFQGATATIMMAQEFADAGLERQIARAKLEQKTVAPRVAATAAEINARIHEVGTIVAEPFRLFAQAAAGARVKTAEEAQQELRDLFGELTADQSDQLKKLMGVEMFTHLHELLQGPVEQFARERRWMRPSMKDFLPQIEEILTPEQWRMFMDAIG